MNPRLIAIAGPLEGAFFALPKRSVSIGRDPSNLLAIDDPSVAPFHCSLEAAGERFGVRSRGRTLVNGLPVNSRELVHGDEIRIGDCLFLFLTYECETPPGLRLERELERLAVENRRLLAEMNLEHDMIGESAAMRRVHRTIARIAPADSTVLIRGESGTGKELVARAIHRNSPRSARPFVAINSASIPETLLESELFGHEKGAFTGAIAAKRGKLEAADGGTLLLDEIAELAPGLQAKLLRVLQERRFERLGGTRPVEVNLRILAATNQDLREAVSRGAFRQDLYYRLNVLAVTLPPLRERRDDIVPLARHFLARFARRAHRQAVGFSPQAEALMTAYAWPGNVRELENAVERAVVLGSTPLVLPEDLPETLFESDSAPAVTYHEAVNAAKRQIILRALEQASSNYTEAARLLGLHPNNLHRLVRNLGLRPLVARGECARATSQVN
ncbi:MAG: sigma 54-dependent Fis family transcriptional regulator [Bryobacterales bacterium]|nr:sigma 54-dependent Fis family transcriptional regulator [Bryobacterales bacterium]